MYAEADQQVANTLVEMYKAVAVIEMVRASLAGAREVIGNRREGLDILFGSPSVDVLMVELERAALATKAILYQIDCPDGLKMIDKEQLLRYINGRLDDNKAMIALLERNGKQGNHV